MEWRRRSAGNEETAMSYTLEEFCAESRDLLAAADTPASCLPEIAAKLGRLVGNKTFVAATFQEETPPGKQLLHRDADTGFLVFAHVQEAGKGGAPHSHGESWAIYGNARGYTDMTEWRRVNPDTADHAVLERTDSYRIGTGATRAYGPGELGRAWMWEREWQ